MTFNQLIKIMRGCGISSLCDIARELDVSPQSVSNWKARNQLPYKYVKILRNKIRNNEESGVNRTAGEYYGNVGRMTMGHQIENLEDDEQSLAELLSFIISKVYSNKIIVLVCPIIFVSIVLIYLKFYAQPIYTSTGKILPVSNNQSQSGLRAIAQQYGIPVGSQDMSILSYKMYPEIIKSRRLVRELLDYKFDGTPLTKLNEVLLFLLI